MRCQKPIHMTLFHQGSSLAAKIPIDSRDLWRTCKTTRGLNHWFSWAPGCALLLAACYLVACARFSGPEGAVRKAFNAFQANDSNAISELMSRQGLANAAVFCGGDTINCLRQNYADNGRIESVVTKVLSESSSTAKVQLITTWADIGKRCQTYTLDKTNHGWRITFFDVPTPCAGP